MARWTCLLHLATYWYVLIRLGLVIALQKCYTHGIANFYRSFYARPGRFANFEIIWIWKFANFMRFLWHVLPIYEDLWRWRTLATNTNDAMIGTAGPQLPRHSRPLGVMWTSADRLGQVKRLNKARCQWSWTITNTIAWRHGPLLILLTGSHWHIDVISLLSITELFCHDRFLS